MLVQPGWRTLTRIPNRRACNVLLVLFVKWFFYDSGKIEKLRIYIIRTNTVENRARIFTFFVFEGALCFLFLLSILTRSAEKTWGTGSGLSRADARGSRREKRWNERVKVFSKEPRACKTAFHDGCEELVGATSQKNFVMMRDLKLNRWERGRTGVERG